VIARRWRTLLALAFAVLALHNLEELLTAPAFVASLAGGLVLELPRGRTVPLAAELYASLAWATLLPALLLTWAAVERAPGRGALAAAWLEVMLLANAAVPHALSAVLLRRYTPGLATALLVDVPFAVAFLRQARAGGRIGRRGLGWAIALGVALYPVALIVVYVLGHFTLAALAAAGLLG
jgi:Protein of unknown function with HXXEE motif